MEYDNKKFRIKHDKGSKYADNYDKVFGKKEEEDKEEEKTEDDS